MRSVTVMGLGYIGLPTAVSMALAGVHVTGFDVSERVITTLKAGRLHIVEPELEKHFKEAVATGRLTFTDVCPSSDIFIISVPTPFLDVDGHKTADLKYVFSAASICAKVLKKGDLVILESTVPPLSTKKMTDLLERESGIPHGEFFTAHCPERVIPGNIMYELKHNDRIIGSAHPEGAEIARELYSLVVTDGEILLTDDRTAELSKLAENTYRDINIAYANELSMIAAEHGIDIFELIALANRHPRVNILNPGAGVGGHCIAIDPWFLADLGGERSKVIRAAREQNDFKPLWVCDQVSAMLDKGKTVAVLGLAFKPDVDDLRESASIVIADELTGRGYRVVAVEPYAPLGEVKGIPNLPLEEAVASADLLLITLAHRQFRENLPLLRSKPYYDCVGLMRVK